MAHIVADRVLENTTTTGTGALALTAAVTGFRRFNAVCATNDTVPYFLEAVDANGVPTGDWETGVGTYSAANQLTRTTVLASSNAGAAVNLAAGTKYVALGGVAARSLYLDHQLAVPLPLASTDPPTAPTAGIKLFSCLRANRALAAFIGPSGVGNILQPQLWSNRVAMFIPGSGTTLGSWGLNATTAATLSHPTLSSAGTLAESLYRTRFATSTTAGNASGARDAVNTIWRGNVAGAGGFFFHARFCSGSISLAGGQKFVGLTSQTTALAGEPSALPDVLGVGKDIADTNWQFMRRTGTGTVQKVSLGVAIANNQTFELTMYCAPNGSAIYVRVVQYTSIGGASTVLLDTNYTTDIPAAGTLVSKMFQVRNGSTAAADNFELVRMYVESDF
jgi:hypothetical protein